MRYIIFDLEATCWDQGEKREKGQRDHRNRSRNGG